MFLNDTELQAPSQSLLPGALKSLAKQYLQKSLVRIRIWADLAKELAKLKKKDPIISLLL